MKRFLQSIEIPALVAVPLVLLSCALFQIEQAALLSLLVATVAILVFFANFELQQPALRQIMPAVVLGALAAAGRLLFAAIPHFKPVSAICILAGVVFGKRTGFMVGALAALLSNFYLGQGPWTCWQMYAWGMIGYLAAVFSEHGLLEKPAALHAYGFCSALLFGVLLNTWHLVGFVQPISWQSALLVYGASLPFDLLHATATVAFLLLIYTPWRKKLKRVQAKYLPSPHS